MVVVVRVPTHPGKPGKQLNFSSHGKHMEKCPGKSCVVLENYLISPFFPLAENELQVYLLKLPKTEL